MIFKRINTGIYDLLLIYVKSNELFDVDLDKKKKRITIKYNESEPETLDFLDLMTENTKGVKLLGLKYNMREKDFRSLLPVNPPYMVLQYFTKKFDELLEENEWEYEGINTLILRI